MEVVEGANENSYTNQEAIVSESQESSNTTTELKWNQDILSEIKEGKIRDLFRDLVFKFDNIYNKGQNIKDDTLRQKYENNLIKLQNSMVNVIKFMQQKPNEASKKDNLDQIKSIVNKYQQALNKFPIKDKDFNLYISDRFDGITNSLISETTGFLSNVISHNIEENSSSINDVATNLTSQDISESNHIIEEHNTAEKTVEQSQQDNVTTESTINSEESRVVENFVEENKTPNSESNSISSSTQVILDNLSAVISLIETQKTNYAKIQTHAIPKLGNFSKFLPELQVEMINLSNKISQNKLSLSDDNLILKANSLLNNENLSKAIQGIIDIKTQFDLATDSREKTRLNNIFMQRTNDFEKVIEPIVRDIQSIINDFNQINSQAKPSFANRNQRSSIDAETSEFVTPVTPVADENLDNNNDKAQTPDVDVKLNGDDNTIDNANPIPDATLVDDLSPVDDLAGVSMDDSFVSNTSDDMGFVNTSTPKKAYAKPQITLVKNISDIVKRSQAYSQSLFDRKLKDRMQDNMLGLGYASDLLEIADNYSVLRLTNKMLGSNNVSKQKVKDLLNDYVSSIGESPLKQEEELKKLCTDKYLDKLKDSQLNKLVDIINNYSEVLIKFANNNQTSVQVIQERQKTIEAYRSLFKTITDQIDQITIGASASPNVTKTVDNILQNSTPTKEDIDLMKAFKMLGYEIVYNPKNSTSKDDVKFELKGEYSGKNNLKTYFELENGNPVEKVFKFDKNIVQSFVDDYFNKPHNERGARITPEGIFQVYLEQYENKLSSINRQESKQNKQVMDDARKSFSTAWNDLETSEWMSTSFGDNYDLAYDTKNLIVYKQVAVNETKRPVKEDLKYINKKNYSALVGIAKDFAEIGAEASKVVEGIKSKYIDRIVWLEQQKERFQGQNTTEIDNQINRAKDSYVFMMFMSDRDKNGLWLKRNPNFDFSINSNNTLQIVVDGKVVDNINGFAGFNVSNIIQNMNGILSAKLPQKQQANQAQQQSSAQTLGGTPSPSLNGNTPPSKTINKLKDLSNFKGFAARFLINNHPYKDALTLYGLLDGIHKDDEVKKAIEDYVKAQGYSGSVQDFFNKDQKNLQDYFDFEKSEGVTRTPEEKAALQAYLTGKEAQINKNGKNVYNVYSNLVKEYDNDVPPLADFDSMGEDQKIDVVRTRGLDMWNELASGKKLDGSPTTLSQATDDDIKDFDDIARDEAGLNKGKGKDKEDEYKTYGELTNANDLDEKYAKLLKPYVAKVGQDFLKKILKALNKVNVKQIDDKTNNTTANDKKSQTAQKSSDDPQTDTTTDNNNSNNNQTTTPPVLNPNDPNSLMEFLKYFLGLNNNGANNQNNPYANMFGALSGIISGAMGLAFCNGFIQYCGANNINLATFNFQDPKDLAKLQIYVNNFVHSQDARVSKGDIKNTVAITIMKQQLIKFYKNTLTIIQDVRNGTIDFDALDDNKPEQKYVKDLIGGMFDDDVIDAIIADMQTKMLDIDNVFDFVIKSEGGNRNMKFQKENVSTMECNAAGFVTQIIFNKSTKKDFEVSDETITGLEGISDDVKKSIGNLFGKDGLSQNIFIAALDGVSSYQVDTSKGINCLNFGGNLEPVINAVIDHLTTSPQTRDLKTAFTQEQILNALNDVLTQNHYADIRNESINKIDIVSAIYELTNNSPTNTKSPQWQDGNLQMDSM